MLITPEPGIRSTIKICNKKGGSFHFEAVPLRCSGVKVFRCSVQVLGVQVFRSGVRCSGVQVIRCSGAQVFSCSPELRTPENLNT